MPALKPRASPAHRERRHRRRLGPPPNHLPALSLGQSQSRDTSSRRQADPGSRWPWRRRGRRAATRTFRRRRRRAWRPRCGATSTASRRAARPSRRAATRRRTAARRPAPGTTTCRSSASCATSRRSPRSAAFAFHLGGTRILDSCFAVEIDRWTVDVKRGALSCAETGAGRSRGCGRRGGVRGDAVLRWAHRHRQAASHGKLWIYLCSCVPSLGIFFLKASLGKKLCCRICKF